MNEIFGSPDCPLLQTAKVSYEVIVRGQELTPSGGHNSINSMMDPKPKCLLGPGKTPRDGQR